jgi:hypothetical protein
VSSPHAAQDWRHFALIDIAIVLAQAQYPMGRIIGGAKWMQTTAVDPAREKRQD